MCRRLTEAAVYAISEWECAVNSPISGRNAIIHKFSPCIRFVLWIRRCKNNKMKRFIINGDDALRSFGTNHLECVRFSLDTGRFARLCGYIHLIIFRKLSPGLYRVCVVLGCLLSTRSRSFCVCVWRATRVCSLNGWSPDGILRKLGASSFCCLRLGHSRRHRTRCLNSEDTDPTKHSQSVCVVCPGFIIRRGRSAMRPPRNIHSERERIQVHIHNVVFSDIHCAIMPQACIERRASTLWVLCKNVCGFSIMCGLQPWPIWFSSFWCMMIIPQNLHKPLRWRRTIADKKLKEPAHIAQSSY